MSDHNALARVLTDQPQSASSASVSSPVSSGSPTSSGPDAATTTYGNQQLWQERVAMARQTATRMIAAGMPFEDIFQFLGTLRQQTAVDQSTSGAREFGKPRLPWRDALRQDDPRNAGDYIEHYQTTYGEDAGIVRGEKTPMGERYAAAGRQALASLSSGAIKLDGSDFARLEVEGRLAATLQTPSLVGRRLTGFRSLGRIGDETIPLTGSVFVGTGEAESAPEPLGMWLHTPPENIPKILAHVGELHASLFPTVADDSDTPAKGAISVAPSGLDGEIRLARVGEMAWWLCHAMPHVRGSASIIEWYIESVLDQCGVSLGKRKEPIDLAAFRISKDDFVRGFRAFFDGDADRAKGEAERSTKPAEAKGESAATLYERDVRATSLLFQNNCLINAIARAARGNTASFEELVTIRSQLGNVGEMLVASPATIAVIRGALGVTRPIVVNYPRPTPAETFAGVGTSVVIRHTGAAHFEAEPS